MAFGFTEDYPKEKPPVDHDKGEYWIYIVIIGLCYYFGS